MKPLRYCACGELLHLDATQDERCDECNSTGGSAMDGAMTFRLGDRVRWTRRAGRYYFWDPSDNPYSGDPYDATPEGPWVTSKDGIPEAERAKIIARLSIDDEVRALDGENLNHGTCDIHVWDEPGEGVIVGKTFRELWRRGTDDDGTFIGMVPTGTGRTNFWEVKSTLRGRRMIIPLDALEAIE